MPEFKSLADQPTDITFNPIDKNAPEGHALSHMYQEVGSNRILAFLLIAGQPHAFIATGDSHMASLAWLRGCIRGVKFLAARTDDRVVEWLTPEAYFAAGGTLLEGG